MVWWLGGVGLRLGIKTKLMISMGGIRAGAHWRTHAEKNEPELCGWEAETYRDWMGMGREERARCGLGVWNSFYESRAGKACVGGC